MRDFALTAATQGTVFIANLLVISILGRLLGVVPLGEYLLVRRVVGWLMSGALLGLGVALPRYVAHAVGRAEGKREAYFFAAACCLAGVATSLGLVLNSQKSFFAYWLFGNPGMSNWILPLSLLIVGLAANAAVYGYHRGCLSMGRANALQCWNAAIIPLLTIGALFKSRSIPLIAGITGIFMALSAALFAIPIFYRSERRGPLNLIGHATELLRYGIRRVLGDFANGALFGLAPVIASHYATMERVSSLLLGISILMAVGVSAGPIGLVLLSKLSIMLAQNRMPEIQRQLEYLLAAVVELSLFACLQILVFADVLVRLWVGPGFGEEIALIQIIAAAIPFYLFYVALRSVIDAASVKAYASRNALLTLGVFLGLVTCAVIAEPSGLMLESLALALLGSIVVLAYLTARTVRHLYQVGVPWRTSKGPILLAILLGAASFLFRRATGFHTGPGQFVFLELILGGVFVALATKQGSPWVAFLLKITFPARTVVVEGPPESGIR